jgi:hypothetical protein
MQAIRSDSSSELPAFSPNALAQRRQKCQSSYVALLAPCSNTSTDLIRTVGLIG